MGTVAVLRKAGFQIRLVPPNQIGIRPSEKLTDEQRSWVRSNRERLLAELTDEAAANAATPEKQKATWQAFIEECLSQGVCVDEVESRFREQDKADLVKAVPLDEVPRHAKTVVDSIKRDRKSVVIEFRQRRHTVKPIHTKRCADCQHFKRIEHRHLGHCTAGEPEGIAGNWDTDNRNYCQSFAKR